MFGRAQASSTFGTAALVVVFGAAAMAAPFALAGGRASSTSQAPDPKAMVLRLGDLPASGFAKRPSSGYVTTAKAQATEARKGENFAALGRSNGYEESFVGATQGGQVTVASSATVFSTVGGAHRALGFIERDGADPNRYRQLAAVRVGAEARLYQVLGVAFTYEIAWRSGSVLSTVVVAGAQASDAVSLGLHQQRRVAAATR
jgi:hypothetical protein